MSFASPLALLGSQTLIGWKPTANSSHSGASGKKTGVHWRVEDAVIVGSYDTPNKGGILGERIWKRRGVPGSIMGRTLLDHAIAFVGSRNVRHLQETNFILLASANAVKATGCRAHVRLPLNGPIE